jgi:DNA-binding transcriptional MocR family regulator
MAVIRHHGNVQSSIGSLDGFRAMDHILRDFRSSSKPLYRHLLTLLEGAIARGDLAAGARLPPERELAARLRVSRTTVVNAYRELESRGLVRGFVGRGTFVCAVPEPSATPFAWRGKMSSAALRSSDSTLRDLVRAASTPGLIGLGAGVPAIDRFPIQAFREAVDHVLKREAHAVWKHGPAEGQPKLRDAIAARCGTRPERVLVLAGAQQGLDLLSRCLVDPGDAVVMDRPGYLGAIQAFRAAGAKVIGWDYARADLDELEDLLLRYRPKLIYTNPTFQNPTGLSLPIRTRRELLKLAGRYRVPIVEDDTYRELYFTAPPPPALQQLDEQDLVIHLNSYSKMLAPGLRIGWLSASGPIIEQLTLIKQRVDPHTQNLVQFAVAHLIETGAFDAHLKALRAEHARRSVAAIRSIERHMPPGALRFERPQGGIYFWCRLSLGVRARDLLQHALSSGVAFVAGEAFYPDPAGVHEMRLCFSSVTPPELDEGIRKLAESVAKTAAERATPQAVAFV